MNGKNVIITGGSSGIGAAAAREFRRLGANVAITGRSAETERLAKEIGAEPFLADFTKFSDVRALAGKLLARYERIDVLANNVGGIVNSRETTVDGFEKTLQVNHLSPFLLTELLRDRLQASRGMVINTASGAHRWGQIDLQHPESRKYNPWRAYGTAKLMNILHADEINRRYSNVLGVSFHPGVVSTGFAREGSLGLRAFWNSIGRLFMISPEKGADTMVWLARTQPSPGYYVKRAAGAKTRAADDRKLASELWEWSLRNTSR